MKISPINASSDQMKLEDKIVSVAGRLEKAGLSYGHGTDNAWDEATWIVLHIFDPDLVGDVDREDFNWQAELQLADSITIDNLVERRILRRIPFAYLANEIWFAGNKFFIDDRAIVPRSYLGEWIPELFEPWINPENVLSILDLCTGCGCIAISCALAFPDANVLASDVSFQALEVAEINIKNYDLGKRVKLNQGDCFNGIIGRFDLIVCNPPYVSDDRMERLPPEFRHEPDKAFRAGQDGLDFIISMLSEVNQFLTNDGTLIVEAGSASFALEERYPEIPFTWLSTEYDETVVFIMTAKELSDYGSIFNTG